MAITPPDSLILKAVVAIPPVCDFYFTPHRFSCLGARIVEKILIKNGFDVDFINFPLIKKHGSLQNIPNDLDYLLPFIIPNETGKLSYFTKFQRFGLSSKECAQTICALKPTLCFLSCFAFSYAKELLDLAKDIKNILPNVPIITGGAGVSAYPLYFIRNTYIDFAFSGEAEVCLSVFLNSFKKKVLSYETTPNLYWKNNGLVVSPHLLKTCNPDEIEAVIAKVHETKSKVFFSTSLSRGCPKSCRFCSNAITHGNAFRHIPEQSLFSLLKQLSIDQTLLKKTVFVNFEDDNLLFSPDFFMNTMRRIRAIFPDIKFLAENGIDYTMLTPDLADQLISLGMSAFNFTLVSADCTIVNNQKRESSLTRFETLVRHISQKGVSVLSYFICGLKGDTKESVTDTLAYLSRLPTTIGISMFYAIPNLPDFKDFDLFDKNAPCVGNGSSAYPWNASLSTSELVTAFRLSRYINLIKSDKKSAIEFQLIEKIEKEKKLFTVFKENGSEKIVVAPEYDDEMVHLYFKK
jgi:anaerobic magnesium-protoporphyrin IX monomethyl ester cyclase